MSLKRYATLLAFGQTQNQKHIIPFTTTSVLATTEEIPSSSYGSFSSEELVSQSQSQSQSQEHVSSSSSVSTHTTYYTGGLGQYHQQRGGSGSVISGVGGGGGPGGPQTYANVVNGNVNLLLGGAMLSLVTTILCVVCYCCHRNIKKRTEAAYRQQHQWVEGDPNMEIYSVEQCYETSGLFLGDSTDGLSAVPALHHEPPPSYDAVVLHEQQLHQQQLEQQQQQQLQLQLQQQQQLLMQRVSPPPGYRSSLDISGGQGTSFGHGTRDGSGDAVAGGSAAGSAGGLLVNKQLQLALNAQSCCSLQRAEVESMWNAAAAAVAARSGNCLEMETLQVCKPTQNIRLNTFGRRYLQQSHQHSGNHYRRGCPLCGKFRYEGEAEDEPLTALSVESGLNMTGRREEPALCPCPSDIDNGNHISGDALQDEANGNVRVCSIDEPPQNEALSLSITSVNDENDNAATSDTPQTTSRTPATSSDGREPEEVEHEQEQEQATGQQVEQDLNNINENGIISLDMSKIIDRSGLPTYEGAIKLESSGYV